MPKGNVPKSTFEAWKRTTYEKPNLMVLKLFQRDFKLSDGDLSRIAVAGKVFSKDATREQRRFQRDVINIYNKIFQKDKMQPLKEGEMDESLVGVYQVASGNPGLMALKAFQEAFNLSDDKLRKMVTEGQIFEKDATPEQKRFQRDAYNIYNKIFTKDKMQSLSEKDKVDPLASTYQIAREVKDPGTLKTEEQQEAAKRATEGILDQPAFQEQQLQPAVQQATTPGGVVRQSLKGLIDPLIGQMEEKVEIPEGATAEQKKAIGEENKAIAERNRQKGVLAKGGKEAFDIVADIAQQGAPPLAPFGGAPGGPAVSAYDALINLIRPGRTGAQSVAAAVAPQATRAGTTIGSTAGTLLGGPVGGAIGSALGALGGYGAQKGLEWLGKPEGELAGLGRLIGGTRPGFFGGGQRGLAGLVSGEDPRSSLATLFGLTRGKAPGGKIGRIRQALGGGLRGVGEFLQKPGAASQLRNILSIAEALPEFGRQLYGLGGQLGINRMLGGLGRRLGILGPETATQQIPTVGGTTVAGAALPQALQFAVPALQQQAAQFLGRPVPAQDVVRGLDQQMQASLAPQMAQQNILESELRGRRQAVELQRAGQQADVVLQGALNKLRATQQQQRFQTALGRQRLSAAEAAQRARIGAQRGLLSAAEVLSGQQMRFEPPIERIPRQPGLAEGLGIAAGALQEATTPYVQQSIQEAFTRPVTTKSAAERKIIK